MFESIRKLVKGWFGYAIMAGICLTFALWGVADYLGVGKPPVAAVVNGEEISSLEIDRQVDRLQQTQAGNLPELSALKRQLLSEIITERLLLQNAENEHLTVSDNTIMQYIQARPEFQDDNGFSNPLFQRLLAENGLTVAGFIESLKKDILKNQLRDAFSQSGFITPNELEGVFDLLEQTRDVQYVRIALEDFASEIVLSDDDIANKYQSSKQQYLKPESVIVEYIELKRSDVQADTKIEPAEVEQYFNEHQAEFRTEEQRKIAHILIAKDEQAEDKLGRINTALEQGDSFNGLVQAYSIDTLSAEKAGELGTFTKATLPAGFSDVVFAVGKEGGYTAPFESDFGWHIVKVLEIKPANQMTFEEAKTSIQQRMLGEAVNDRMVLLEEDLAQLAFEVPDTLVEAAKALALEIKTTKSFTRNTPEGLFSNPKLLAAVFSEEVLLERNNSSVIEVSDDHLVVVRVKEHSPEEILPLSAVKGRIEADLSHQMKQEAAREKAEEIQAQLIAASNQASDVKAPQLTWTKETGVARNDTRLPFPLTSVIFERPVNPNYFSVEELANGDLAIVSVLKRDQQLLASERAREKVYSQALVSRMTGLEFLLYANSLEGDSDIELMEGF